MGGRTGCDIIRRTEANLVSFLVLCSFHSYLPSFVCYELRSIFRSTWKCSSLLVPITTCSLGHLNRPRSLDSEQTCTYHDDKLPCGQKGEFSRPSEEVKGRGEYRSKNVFREGSVYAMSVSRYEQFNVHSRSAESPSIQKHHDSRVTGYS